MSTRWISLFGLGLSLCACEAKVTTVEVIPAKIELSQEKLKETLSFAAKDEKGKKIEGKQAQWASADPKIATITGNQVNATGSGTTQVTAKVGEIIGTGQVKVVLVKGLKIDAEKIELAVDAEPRKLSAVFVNERGEPVNVTRPVIWTVKDPNVATVSQGEISGVAPGTTTVEAAAAELKATAEIVITEKAAPPAP